MVQIMGIINLTPDSFFEKSRYNYSILDSEAHIVDVGAVSTRPGAEDVSLEEEWSRLEPFLLEWAKRKDCVKNNASRKKDIPQKKEAWTKRLSIDTTNSKIVRRAYKIVGDFIVNDISAGLDDPDMLACVGELGLDYIAMHKEGNPRTMDALAKPEHDIIDTLISYFEDFSIRAQKCGIHNWILDPGLGFAKTEAQNIEIIERLSELKQFNRPILIGAADKRFTHGNTEYYHGLSVKNGADILRVHNVEQALNTIKSLS